MTHYFTVPGLGGSGGRHWQTYFERTGKNFRRIEQKDWDAPDLEAWTQCLDETIAPYDPQSVVLVGHSLGCLTIVAWAKKYEKRVKAAFLVAPPELNTFKERLQTPLLDAVDAYKLPFPSTLVASTNDPWITVERSAAYAHSWGSRFVNIGAAGHINQASGHYAWLQGLEMLQAL